MVITMEVRFEDVTGVRERLGYRCSCVWEQLGEAGIAGGTLCTGPALCRTRWSD